MPEPTTPLLDCEQLDGLAAQAGEDPNMRAVLGRIWRESSSDAVRELRELPVDADSGQVRSTLHRVRGLLSMWGLAKASAMLNACENAGDSPGEWRRQAPEIFPAIDASSRAVVDRHPWLAHEEAPSGGPK